MTRYIDADVAIKMKGISVCGDCAHYNKKKHYCMMGAKKETNAQDPFYDDCPLPDVAPVVHGRWKGAGMGDYYCSLCCEEVSGNRHKFCPNCGAKMDLEE